MVRCSAYCEHEHADLAPHIAPLEREAQRRASNRTWEALMLAQTPETWAALIHGQPVPEDQVDRTAANRHIARMGGR